MFKQFIGSLVTILIFVSSLGLSVAAQAQANDYPNKPIKVVVTFPPGGSSDAILRMLSPRLNEKLGQQLVIENRPGAGGNIGLNVVAKANADGYLIGVGAAGGLTANPSLYPQMPFDVNKELTPITLLASIPFVIVPPFGAGRNPPPTHCLGQGATRAHFHRPWGQWHGHAFVHGLVHPDGRHQDD